METYIKLFRRFQNWGWYNDPPTKDVFLELMLRARFEPKEYRGITLEQGQCIIGRKELADKLGLSERQVRTALEHLKSTNEIATKTTNKFTIVTVENWTKWQVEECEPTSEVTSNSTNNRPTTDQQPTTNKESKEDKEYKEINKYGFVPPTLNEVDEYIQENKLEVDSYVFYGYYEELGWCDKNGKPVKSWKLKCRTWHNNELRRRNSNEIRGKTESSQSGAESSKAKKLFGVE